MAQDFSGERSLDSWLYQQEQRTPEEIAALETAFRSLRERRRAEASGESVAFFHPVEEGDPDGWFDEEETETSPLGPRPIGLGVEDEDSADLQF